MDANRRCLRSAGRTFSEAELEVVTEVVGNGGSHSRTQLMIRVCQRLQWYRPTGALKVRECRDLLATMERAGWFRVAGETRRTTAGLAHRGAGNAGWRAGAAGCSARWGSSAACAWHRWPPVPTIAGGVN